MRLRPHFLEDATLYTWRQGAWWKRAGFSPLAACIGPMLAVDALKRPSRGWARNAMDYELFDDGVMPGFEPLRHELDLTSSWRDR
jgi:hypothetical protein